MTQQTGTAPPPAAAARSENRPACSFDDIREPGAYVCRWNGHLLRVPRQAIATGGHLVIAIHGRDALLVTKISDDPFVPIGQARRLASNFDLQVGF